MYFFEKVISDLVHVCFSLRAGDEFSYDQPEHEYPDKNEWDGIVPFFGFSVLPHSLGFLAVTLEGVIWDQMNRESDQRREDDQVVKVSDNRDEVRDEVDRRKGIDKRENSHRFGIPGSFRAFQAQENGWDIGF